MTAALELNRLRMRFGGLRVLDGVSLALRPGDRHAVIGPNGAGKTTLVNLITGRLRPQHGTILFGGRDVTRLPMHRRTRLGLVRTFQISSLFGGFSALENIALAVAERERCGLSLRTRRGFPSAVADEAEAIGLQVGLPRANGAPVRELAYGQQRLVEFALALALRPRVLLLDEPAAGLARADHERLIAALATLPPEVAVLLIEHDMALVFRFARRVSVLAAGAILAEGTPAEIAGNQEVRDIYLGTRR
jgi:branched-chain amino acid transport system ATP-binding protein